MNTLLVNVLGVIAFHDNINYVEFILFYAINRARAIARARCNEDIKKKRV